MRVAHRDLGAASRRLSRASVLLAGGVYLVATGDLAPAGLFVILFSLPAGSPVFEPFRRLESASVAIFRAAVFLLPMFEILIRTRIFGAPAFDGTGGVLAHPILVLLILRVQSERLPSAGHIQLITGGFVLVAIGATCGTGRLLLPAIGIWIIPTAAALGRIHLETEINRTLALARVRPADQDHADEVSGRGGAFSSSALSSLSLVGMLLLAGGMLLFWLSPPAARGVSFVYTALAGAAPAPAGEEGLPESDDDIPPFAVPPGVVGYLPFGPRLERDEFMLRRQQDGITVLIREARVGMGLGVEPLVRGECYDFLTGDGRWIRSLRRESAVRDDQDGTKDECVVVDGSGANVTTVVECLVPPGPDRIIYVPAVPVKLWLPEIAMDGTGNYLDPEGRSPRSSYVVESSEPYLPDSRVVHDPGPEFLLLPDDLDAGQLAALVEPVIEFAEDDFERAQLIRAFLLMKFLNLPDDAPERAGVDVSMPPPGRLDVAGFLFTRRWGSSIDFASAYAMLLRSVGIPCRLATGYRKGAYLTRAGFFVFRADDLVAFVEVPFQGFGWFPLDATPLPPDLPDDALGEVLLRPPEERGDEAARLEAEERHPGLVGQLLGAIDGWISSVLPGDRKSSGTGKFVGVVMLIGVTVVVLRALIALSARGRAAIARRLSKVEGGMRALFYERLLKILARRGLRRRSHETPLEFARAVTGKRGLEFADVQRLTNAFCATRYGGRVIGGIKETELLDRAEKLGQMLDRQDRERRQRVLEGRKGKRRRVWPFSGLMVLLGLAAGSIAAAATPRELVEKLGAEEQVVRQSAREELLLLRAKAMPVLLGALRSEPETDRQEEIEHLVRELDADDYDIRARATKVLKEIGPAAREAVSRALEFESPEARRRARDILRFMDGDGKLIYQSRSVGLARRRGEVLLILGIVGDERAVDVVLQAGLAWPGFARRAQNALRKLVRRYPERFYALLVGSDPRVRRIALKALIAVRPGDLAARLSVLDQDPDPELRRLARNAFVTARVVEETDRARLLLLQEDNAEARAALYRALSECPGYLEATWILVGLLEEEGDFRAALEALRAVAEPDLDMRLQMAGLLSRLGRTEEASAAAAALIERQPGDYRVHLLAANTLLARDPPAPRLALARAERAVELAPEVSEPWAMLGRILGEFLDDPAAARGAYRRALMLDTRNDELRTELKKYLGR